MSKNVAILEPVITPVYVKWRRCMIGCIAVFVIAAHGLVWFSTWSDRKGNSYMEVCGIWLVISALASIGTAVSYADAKDRWNRHYSGSSRGW